MGTMNTDRVVHSVDATQDDTIVALRGRKLANLVEESIQSIQRDFRMNDTGYVMRHHVHLISYD